MKIFGVAAVLVAANIGVGQTPARAERVAAGQSQPVPRPFPNSSTAKPADPAPAAPGPTTQPQATPARPTPPPTTAPSPQAASPAQPGRPSSPDAAPPGTPIYPTAEFIDSYDAGSGQRYYLYGTNAAYTDIVAYYRNVLKNSGRELYKIPPMQQFDLGRYDEETMVYPPSVVVKDYTWNGSPGYLAVSGTTEKRFKTVIQIVPPTTAR